MHCTWELLLPQVITLNWKYADGFGFKLSNKGNIPLYTNDGYCVQGIILRFYNEMYRIFAIKATVKTKTTFQKNGNLNHR